MADTLPVITDHPVDITVFVDEASYLSVGVSNPLSVNYQWQHYNSTLDTWENETQAIGYAGGTLIFSKTPASANGLWRCAITNDSGTVYTNSATLTVITPNSQIQKPTITLQPTNVSVVNGHPIPFEVNASGENLNYRWMIGDNFLVPGKWIYADDYYAVGFDSQSVVFKSGVLDYSTVKIKCKVWNEGGYVYSDVVSVEYITIEIVLQPENQRALTGESVKLEVEARSSAPLSYQWQKKQSNANWENIADATLPLYSFVATVEDNVISYRCVISNTLGASVTSNTVAITVGANAPTITQSPQNVTVDESDTVTLVAAGIGAGTLEYQWQVKTDTNWSNIFGATQSSYTFSSQFDQNENEYRCAISNEYGTSYTDVAKLTVNMIPPQIITQPLSQTVREGMPVTFSIVVEGSSVHHQWQISTDGETWINLKSTSVNSYTHVASINLNGHQIRDVISNNAGTVYSDPAILTVTTDDRLAAPTIITQPSTLSLTEDQTGTFDVVADGEDISYQWQILQNEVWCFINGANESSLSVTGILTLNGSKYRCVISNPAGTVYSDEVVLLVNEGSKIKTPSIYSQPRSVSVEAGTTVYFRVLANGGSLEYQWERKRGNTWYSVSGATTNVLSFRATEDMNGDQYRCWVTNPAGGEASTLATLTVTERGPVPMYGYHSIIISGKNTYGEWTMYPTSRPHIAPPEVKTSYVEVPGADGGLDYTELLNDKPNYGYRKGSWEFLLIPQDQWPNVYRSLCNFLHGREHTVVLEDDPNWMYTGRLSVNEWRSAAHNSLITIDYILDPDPINISGEEYDQDELDLEGAERILRKPGNTDKAIVLWNNVATVVPISDMYEDGDNIAY